MELAIAKQKGGTALLIAQIGAIFILELLWFLTENSADYANGIIFFIDAQMNADVFIFYILLLGMTWLLGRQAGRDILSRSGSIATVLKYVLISSVVMFVYVCGVYYVHNGYKGIWGVIPVPVLLITVSIVVAWFCATWGILKIKSAYTK